MDKRQELLKSAYALFTEVGYKATNISKITKNAGMATGTFYNYFDSKDAIFMELYIEENKKLKQKIFKTVNLDSNPMEVMGTLMTKNYDGMIDNPILKHWYDRESFHKIEDSFKKSKGIEKLDFFYDDFIKIITYWQDKGKMRRDIEPRMIMAIFDALIHVDLNKDQIGAEFFPEIMNHLSVFVMDGLTKME